MRSDIFDVCSNQSNKIRYVNGIDDLYAGATIYLICAFKMADQDAREDIGSIEIEYPEKETIYVYEFSPNSVERQ